MKIMKLSEGSFHKFHMKLPFILFYHKTKYCFFVGFSFFFFITVHSLIVGNVQSNLNSSYTDCSFTMANSKCF